MTVSEKTVVIITGASSGIGEATARLLGITHNYSLVLAARRVERLQALADEIEAAGGQALPVATDVTHLGDIQHLVEAALARFGRIDVLFNNAGFGRMKWLEELDPVRDIDLQLKANILGVIQTTRAVLPHMIQQRSGHIINMASVAGLVATPTYSIYSASKFAVRGFTEALRREVGIWNIRVTGIYPGGVATEFVEHTGVKRKTGLSTPKLLKLTAEDLAGAVFKIIQNPRRMVVLPWPMKVTYWFNILFPGLVDWSIEHRFTIPERLNK
ncbi:MAG: SDR family oxidoreductase [Anaerolineae bacterium]|nr:SDR family oxidoreductase [Anaerolineae bacterium]